MASTNSNLPLEGRSKSAAIGVGCKVEAVFRAPVVDQSLTPTRTLLAQASTSPQGGGERFVAFVMIIEIGGPFLSDVIVATATIQSGIHKFRMHSTGSPL